MIFKKILLVTLVFDLVILNSFLIYYFFHQKNNIIVQSCDQKCKEDINSKLNELSEKLEELKLQLSITPTAIPTIKKESITIKSAPKQKKKNTFYVDVPGSGSLLSYDWADLSTTQFYFDTSDFPGLKNIYFEANMKLFNGNGLAFARLFDSTHGIGVQGSEVQTGSQKDTIVTSGQVTFFAGKNLIKVQIKSLTADTTVFNSGRLKITTEN